MNDNRLLDALACRGVLVSVHVRYWRARRKLNPEDLGLESERINARLVSLGHKRLLPKERLQGLALVESRARALVEENTFPFLNGVARFLPNERLVDVDAALENLRIQFESEVDSFLASYPEFRAQALEEWAEAARELCDDPERLVAVVADAFPEPNAMRRLFEFRTSLFQVSVPDVPRAELVEAGVQQEIAEAREKAAREARVRIERSCEEFIGECATELRGQTAKLCAEMLQTIDGPGSVHQKTLNRLLRFIEHFRQLNFVNDTEMERQLENVRGELLQRTAGEYRDSDEARHALVQGLETLRERAATMARRDATELVEGFGRLGERRFALVA